MDIEQHKVLVIFSEPHAYISPSNYEKELNVPTWNYISIHAYGHAKLITETDRVFEVLEATINNYEIAYRQQWDNLPETYKLNMSKGIVAFEVIVTDLQAKKKLSQNRTAAEQQKIIDKLSANDDRNEQLIADYMKKN
jgi:transcriptional regulator